MKEKYYEELLNIKTTGDQSWDETKKCYHPYEPTPYFALDKLFESYYLILLCISYLSLLQYYFLSTHE